ncbi:MAG: zinc-ribbon domain-containing protein [Myxococcales bacterium]|nr:zinc-ribbon domain-containing protein [Myxococcales bacterium]
MVVQCPTCQSKFRIADDKVTDRGVRVRCTSCKNVFQVRKPGASASEAAPGPGNTMDLSSLGAAAVARGGGSRPGAASRPAAARPGASKPAPSRPAPSRPAPAASARSPNGTARRLDADDLFGMAELTGDAPLGDVAPPASRPPTGPVKPAAKPMPNFDDIDLEVPDEPSGPPPPKPSTGPVKASRPPTGKVEPPPPPLAEDEPPSPTPDEPAGGDGAATIGAFKDPMKDPFEGMNLGQPGTGAIDIATQAKKDNLGDAAAAEVAAKASEPAPPPPAPEISSGRDLVSSALTGLVGAALAIAVVIVAALSDESSAGWFGFGRGSEIVATRVVSGLYDTASGKPVFYIRGRVENRSQTPRGPIRVTAELVSDGAAEAKAEAIAGAEPTAEEVWSLRSAADVDKLNHALEISRTERKVEPGKSLPFFAVIADPPPDLQRHRLHVKVESVDAWVPQAPRKGK